MTPAQQRVVDDLMAFTLPRPTFDPAVAGGLRRRMEEALAPVADGVGGLLRVTKHDLSNVHTCEAYYRVEKDAFTWGPRNAYGAVAHRAVRLSVTLRDDPAPLDLVDMAIDASVADDQGGGLGPYLAGAPAVELAELRAQANDVVVQFLECFPPLRREWRPRTDTPILVKLCDDRISPSREAGPGLRPGVGQ